MVAPTRMTPPQLMPRDPRGPRETTLWQHAGTVKGVRTSYSRGGVLGLHMRPTATTDADHLVNLSANDAPDLRCWQPRLSTRRTRASLLATVDASGLENETASLWQAFGPRTLRVQGLVDERHGGRAGRRGSGMVGARRDRGRDRCVGLCGEVDDRCVEIVAAQACRGL